MPDLLKSVHDYHTVLRVDSKSLKTNLSCFSFKVCILNLICAMNSLIKLRLAYSTTFICPTGSHLSGGK